MRQEIKGAARRVKEPLSSVWWRYVGRRAPNIFCISMQKTGTTSVGKFLHDVGFRTAGWDVCERNEWGEDWYEGDYESIFSSVDFRRANAFEDAPWWYPGFYKVLYHRFPGSKFILFERDPDTWFESMLRHSGGDVLGRSRIHCKIYRREPEYFRLIEREDVDAAREDERYSDKTMKIYDHDDHYKKIYRTHNTEVKDFFERHDRSALHVGRLEDPGKWQKLGSFLGVSVPDNYSAHLNRSDTENINV